MKKQESAPTSHSCPTDKSRAGKLRVLAVFSLAVLPDSTIRDVVVSLPMCPSFKLWKIEHINAIKNKYSMASYYWLLSNGTKAWVPFLG